MKKDIVIAVIVGFILGASFALAFLNLPTLLKKETSDKIADLTVSITPEVEQIIDQKSKFKIETPSDNSFSDDDSIEIKGSSTAESIISAISDANSAITKTDKDGHFSLAFDLYEGGNNIYMTSIGKNGEEETKNIIVFYTSEKI